MSLLIAYLLLSVLGILAALAASFYNVYSVKWGLSTFQEDREYYSNRWHFWSGGIRFSVFVIVLLAGLMSSLSYAHVFFISLLYMNFAFTGYNLIYNKHFDHKWYYTGSKASGTGSVMDKFFGKGIIALEGLLLLFTVLWYPLDLYPFVNSFIHSFQIDWVSLAIAIAIAIASFFGIRKFYNK